MFGAWKIVGVDCMQGLWHAYVIFLPSGGHSVNMFVLNCLLLQLLTDQGSCVKTGNPENPDLKKRVSAVSACGIFVHNLCFMRL